VVSPPSYIYQAYDRVAAPAALVTSGIYAHIQHPIYTSYVALFSGFCLVLHSAPLALLLAAVCAAYYYRGRCRMEADVLRRAFGAEYDAYAARTKLFLPILI
jgi:protein-S-isoprenylcysteine O-methyltransferase Ste14